MRWKGTRRRLESGLGTVGQGLEVAKISRRVRMWLYGWQRKVPLSDQGLRSSRTRDLLSRVQFRLYMEAKRLSGGS